MITVYFCGADELDKYLESVLSRHICAPFEILRTAEGKPYIEGNPVYFSKSHKKTRAAFAISDKPVGIDMEVLTGRERNSILQRFSERERSEISCERDFLNHWTAREAFVKLYGYTLLNTYRRIEFYGGKIYLDGIVQQVKLESYSFENAQITVCLEQ